MNVTMGSDQLLEALAWLHERGYYESEENYHDDRVRVNIHREQYGEEMTTLTMYENHINLSPEDQILFKLTFGGK